MTTWEIGQAGEVNDLLSENHYLGPIKTGGNRLIVKGVREGVVVAAQVWRRPTSRHLPFDGSWLELSRWCLTPEAGEYAGSRMHAAAVRIIKRDLPGVTTLVSYSDPRAGHTGALYRSCNWQWRPTWVRLRPPPSGGGAWQKDKPQAPKDRWVFAVRRDPAREAILRINDAGAIRHWLVNAPPEQRRWASGHPQLEVAA